MLITERQLRRIVREVLISEAAATLATKPATTPPQTTPPTTIGPSDIAGTQMYGAKVGTSASYDEYRIYTNGTIKIFGHMKNNVWKMEDPAKDVAKDQLAIIAKKILDANQYDANAKTTLSNIVAGSVSSQNEGWGSWLMTKLEKALISANAPIHLVAFGAYLCGRTAAFTENDLPANYQTDLAKVAKYAMTRQSPQTGVKGQILHSNPFVYNDFWRNASILLGQGTPGTPLDGKGVLGTGTVESLEFFLGGIVVKQSGDNYIIEDIYDYDDYYKSPQAFQHMSQFIGSMEKAGGLYQMVRNAATFRQSSGYAGFPVRITLPMSLAANFNPSKK